MLDETPSRINQAVDQVPPRRLRMSPAPNEWSVTEVLAHLRACADVWGACIDTILVEQEPTIRAVNPRRRIKSTDYMVLDFATSFSAFAAQRAGLLTVLRPLSPAKWSRQATIVGAGKPLVRTAFDYAQRLARHERAHIKQIRTTVAALA
jgi:hypothetical protein